MAVFKNIATINPTDGNPFYVLSLQSSEFVLGSSAGDFTFGIVLPKVNQTGTIKLVPGMKFTITDRDGYITSGGPQIFRHVNETSTVIINGQSITASVGYSMMDVPFTSYVLTYNGDGIWTMLEGADGNIQELLELLEHKETEVFKVFKEIIQQLLDNKEVKVQLEQEHKVPKEIKAQTVFKELQVLKEPKVDKAQPVLEPLVLKELPDKVLAYIKFTIQ